MKVSTPGTVNDRDQTLHAVYFEYIDPAARSVAIAGTFNDWRPQVTPMVNMGAGRWRKLLMVTPGSYEYAFVVDGRWLKDGSTSRGRCRATTLSEHSRHQVAAWRPSGKKVRNEAVVRPDAV